MAETVIKTEKIQNTAEIMLPQSNSPELYEYLMEGYVPGAHYARMKTGLRNFDDYIRSRNGLSSEELTKLFCDEKSSVFSPVMQGFPRKLMKWISVVSGKDFFQSSDDFLDCYLKTIIRPWKYYLYDSKKQQVFSFERIKFLINLGDFKINVEKKIESLDLFLKTYFSFVKNKASDISAEQVDTYVLNTHALLLRGIFDPKMDYALAGDYAGINREHVKVMFAKGLAKVALWLLLNEKNVTPEQRSAFNRLFLLCRRENIENMQNNTVVELQSYIEEFLAAEQKNIVFEAKVLKYSANEGIVFKDPIYVLYKGQTASVKDFVSVLGGNPKTALLDLSGDRLESAPKKKIKTSLSEVIEKNDIYKYYNKETGELGLMVIMPPPEDNRYYVVSIKDERIYIKQQNSGFKGTHNYVMLGEVFQMGTFERSAYEALYDRLRFLVLNQQ